MNQLIQVDTIEIDGQQTSLETALKAVFDDTRVAAEAQARQEAAQAERDEAEEARLRRMAARALDKRGHWELAKRLSAGKSACEEDRPYLEAAAMDRGVPVSLKIHELYPRLNAIDAAWLANGAFGAFMEEIALATQVLFVDEQPDVECAKEALWRGKDIRSNFDRQVMQAIERVFEHAELPRLPEIVRQCPALDFAVVMAQSAMPRKKASALLRHLQDELWSRINEIRDAQRQSHRQRELAKAKENRPMREGKTARKRETDPNRDVDRRNRQLARAASTNTPPAAGGKKKKK